MPGIEPGTSGYVARNYDHWITETVIFIPSSIKNEGEIVTANNEKINCVHVNQRKTIH
jgi:hypothetical protein